MIWWSGPEEGSRYSSSSRKRGSELKGAQDLGTHFPTRGSVRSGPSEQPESPRTKPMMASRTLNAPGHATPRRHVATLELIAEQRRIGQTYVRLGNLAAAKMHLEEAERMLKEVGAKHESQPGDVDTDKSDNINSKRLEEFKLIRKDTYN